MTVKASRIAAKAEPGQFIILRTNETGERIPLTVADTDAKNGTVTIIFGEVGKTTKALGAMKAGGIIADFVGPLGKPSELEGHKKVAVVAGGLGAAIAYPQAKKLKKLGTEVHFIAGFRSKEFIILEEESKAVSDLMAITTDDGSGGVKGFVTDALKTLMDAGNRYDTVIAIGPLIMMKAVSALTKEYGIDTVVSMCPIMIDGTGMCGGCRLTVGGEVKFACVDGPEFDGHKVDFDAAIRRLNYYKPKENVSLKKHMCRMEGMADAKCE